MRAYPPHWSTSSTKPAKRMCACSFSIPTHPFLPAYRCLTTERTIRKPRLAFPSLTSISERRHSRTASMWTIQSAIRRLRRTHWRKTDARASVTLARCSLIRQPHAQVAAIFKVTARIGPR